MITYYQTVQKTLLPVSVIEKIVYQTQKGARVKKVGDVSVHMIGDTKMITMNTLYRGKVYPTDVLSFPTADAQDIGDIFICVPQIIRQAKRFHVSPSQECVRMLAHGVLHLLGYDHHTKKEADEMFALQEKIVKKHTIR